MKRYNMFLPVQMMESLRSKAASKGITVSELIRQVLMAYAEGR